jgi:hypothetical protein
LRSVEVCQIVEAGGNIGMVDSQLLFPMERERAVRESAYSRQE